MPTFIHEIVERYVFKFPICFAFVTMWSNCRKLLQYMYIIYGLVEAAFT